jgi:hypothetical protein
MKKLMTIVLAVLTAAVLLAGCSTPASSAATPTPLASDTATVSAAPGDSAAPADTAIEDDSDGDIGKKITIGDTSYYLDLNDPSVTDNNEDPPLHMVKTDGSNDKNLNIQGFDFDIYGNYIYLDQTDPNLNEDGNTTWSTVRLNLDGTGMKKLEYGNMASRYLPDGSQTFYFTTEGDSAIYTSDLACENVQAHTITFPDKKDLDTKLGTEYVTSITGITIENNQLKYDVTLQTVAGMDLYYGTYRTSLDFATTTKDVGNYVNTTGDGTGDDTAE